MDHAGLRGLDLNLLLALDALLSEQSVTRAAQQTRVTQPAMSQALARLRDHFDDPLLVRSGRGMAPTARASELSGPLHHLLSELDNLVHDGRRFTPESSTRTFHVACLDHFSALHLPSLVAEIRETAPGVDIVTTQLSHDSLNSELERGAVDIGIGVFTGAPAGQMQRTLHQEKFACILRPDHPALERWDLDGFVSFPHGLLSTTGRGQGVVDRALAPYELTRRVAVRVPHFLAAAALAESSDLIFTVAGRLGSWFANHYDVVCVEPPLPLAEYPIAMRWHRRAHEDPAHRWFRDCVVECAQ